MTDLARLRGLVAETKDRFAVSQELFEGIGPLLTELERYRNAEVSRNMAVSGPVRYRDRRLEGGKMTKQPFRVQCDVDGHIWIAAYTPMEMGALARILKSIRCPMCGAPTSKIRCLMPEKGIEVTPCPE